MRSSLLVTILLAASTIPAGESLGASSSRAHLTGEEMVPPVETHATGHVVLQLNKDGSELLYKLVVANVENVTSARLHLGSAGKTGAAVAQLYPSGAKTRADGKVNGTLSEAAISATSLTGPLAGQPLAELLKQIEAGNVYVCLCTRAHPDGEIRGQVR